MLDCIDRAARSRLLSGAQVVNRRMVKLASNNGPCAALIGIWGGGNGCWKHHKTVGHGYISA